MNTSANRLKLILFEGNAPQISDRANAWLAEQPAGVRVVSLEYNYQGSEYLDGAIISVGEHGILLAYTEGESRHAE